MDSPPPCASLDHLSSIKTGGGEGEMKLCTPQPGLIAVAFSSITLKAISGRGVVKEREGGVMEVDRPVGPAMHHKLYTTGL